MMINNDINVLNKTKTRKLFNAQVVFGTSFTVLTGGVFLNGLAMYMGASDLLANYIGIIANICGISILFFSSIIQKFQSLKKVAVGLTALSKFATLILVLIPPLNLGAGRIAIFIPLLIIAFTLQAQTTVVLNNWLVTFVDKKNSGRHISMRQTFVLIVSVILSLAGGRIMDNVQDEYIGFVILFAVALVMSIIEIFTLLLIPDVRQVKIPAKKNKIIDTFKAPAKNKPFILFVVYVFFFYLLLYIADSFTVIYMMRYLNLSYMTTTAMQMIISLPQVLLLAVWGKISDKKGHKFALKTSIWFFAGETLFLSLTAPQNLYIFIPIAFSFAAIGNAGFIVSAFNRRYELMPSDGRLLYDNFYTAAIGLAFILGPVIGEGIKTLFEVLGVSEVIQFGNIRLLYAVSAAAIIILQIIVYIVDRARRAKVCCDENCQPSTCE